MTQIEIHLVDGRSVEPESAEVPGMSACDAAIRLHAALPSTSVTDVVSGQLYAWANELARQIVALAAEVGTGELADLFATLDDLLEQQLTPEARSFIVMGILDSLQSMTTHPAARVRSADLVPLFGAATREEWDRLHAVWGSSDDFAVA